MPSRNLLSASLGPGLLLGLVCAFAVPQEAAAQFRAYGYYGYGAGPYYDGPYGPYGDRDYYDGPYRRHGYYGPDEADLGPEPYRDVAPAPRKPAPAKAASPDAGKTSNKSEAKKTELLASDVIEKKVRSAGYRLIAAPRHNGEIYLAEVEDNKSNRRRLVYDAFDGRLIENTVLGPAKPGKAASSKAE